MERIKATNISKKFDIGRLHTPSFLGSLVNIFSGREPKREFQVLDDISFYANKGEIVGIIGDNGSGKSTLLRVLAGIYTPDKGKVETNGKIISLINLFSGFQFRLTARDNIYLCASLLGSGWKETTNKIDKIIKFAELEEFLETKIYQYSSGMLQRLAFSIAIHCKPDILILDEVFAVGDFHFLGKSSNKIKELVDQGVTVVIVSHDLGMIEQYCGRVYLIEKGKVVGEGEAKKLIKEYVEGNKR